jgi:hypothetical protein
MLKIINCVDCEPINYFTKIYSYDTSVESQVSLYLGIPSIGCTQDILKWAWRMVRGAKSGSVIIEGILIILES